MVINYNFVWHIIILCEVEIQMWTQFRKQKNLDV